MTTTFASTARLLFLCARTQLTAAAREEIRRLAANGVDWEHLRHASNKNNVELLVLRALETCCPDAVPEETARRMRTRAELKTARNRTNVDVLLETLDLLRENGIQAIPIKGVTFALANYGDLSLRCIGDVDILVRRADYLPAKNLLIRNGHRQTAFGDVETAAGQAMLTRDDGRPGIDLHYDVTPPCQHPRRPEQSLKADLDAKRWNRLNTTSTHWFFSLDSGPMWERLDTLAIDGVDVPLLSAEDQLTVALVHGTKEAWRCLNRVCDIAELVRARPEMDWDRVFGLWSQLRSERKLALGLLLARRLLDAPLPEDVSRRVSKSAPVRSVATAAAHRLGHAGHPPGIEEFRLVSALFVMESPRDRVHYLGYIRRRLGDFAYRPRQYLSFAGRVLRHGASTAVDALRGSRADPLEPQ